MGIYDLVDLINTPKQFFTRYCESKFYNNRLKSNLKTNQTLFSIEKPFFYTILGFTRSRSYPLVDIEGFYQVIAGSYRSDRPTNNTEIDEILSKCDCINGSIVNVFLEYVLYSFALSSPPGH